MKQVFTNPEAGDSDLPGGGVNATYVEGIAVDGSALLVADQKGRRFRMDPATGVSPQTDQAPCFWLGCQFGGRLCSERLEGQDRQGPIDAFDLVKVRVDESANVDFVWNVELGHKVILATGREYLGRQLGIGQGFCHVVCAAKVAFEVDEKALHGGSPVRAP